MVFKKAYSLYRQTAGLLVVLIILTASILYVILSPAGQGQGVQISESGKIATIQGDEDEEESPGPSPTQLDHSICAPTVQGLSPNITNPYFYLPVGTKWILEGVDAGAAVRLEITSLSETKVVAGVTTRIIEEKETEDGQLTEIARNYFVQTTNGTVCYYGEDVDFYENGQIIGHEGSWLAGVNGSLPGIQMPAAPAQGQTFKQEVAPGIAQDEAKIIEAGQTVVVPLGTFTDTIKFEELNPLDGMKSYKTFAKGAGLIVDDFMKRTTGGTPLPTLTVTPTKTPTTTLTPTTAPSPSISPTIVTTATPTITLTIAPDDTKLRFQFWTEGIGLDTQKGKNNNPVRKEQPIQIQVFDIQNPGSSGGTKIKDVTGNASFNSEAITYGGIISIGSVIKSNIYQIKTRFNNTLWRAQIVRLQSGQINNLIPYPLVLGDLDQNNVLDLVDYNALLSCYGTKECASKEKADLNMDGKVDEKDLNILLSGFAKRQGD